ncbi:hypothetical protein [Actinoplanes siamensis]|uniref:hypothetical protein n=1 Tax=Actinoplanes siamensis TaxID=1223317 RepID=UPI001943D034|nr:hypothetical protein [Actinoplanes siamensis]
MPDEDAGSRALLALLAVVLFLIAPATCPPTGGDRHRGGGDGATVAGPPGVRTANPG